MRPSAASVCGLTLLVCGLELLVYAALSYIRKRCSAWSKRICLYVYMHIRVPLATSLRPSCFILQVLVYAALSGPNVCAYTCPSCFILQLLVYAALSGPNVYAYTCPSCYISSVSFHTDVCAAGGWYRREIAFHY
jgi:hypothetical protein